MDKIDLKFIDLCNTVAFWSRDKSTKVGAVVVGPDREVRTLGYNGFPRGINDNVDERYERPLKYSFTCHAEENSITNAARVGIPLKGCAMYLQWFPCSTCSRMIIQAGISRIVVKKTDFEELKENLDPNRINWGKDFEISKTMLDESGIEIINYGE